MSRDIAQMNELDCLRELIAWYRGGDTPPVTPVATSLVFSTQPGSATAGDPFGQQPVVTVKDQFGATFSTTANVTMSKVSGPGTLSGTLVVACVGGVATFTDLQVDTAGDYVLRATLASPALSVDSNSFSVAASGGFSLIASASAGSANALTVDTTGTPINTTGADLLVLVLSCYIGTPTIGDSKGNTWSALTTIDQSIAHGTIYYCESPIVGTNHTFSCTGAASPAIAVAAFSGALSVGAFDQQNGASHAAPTGQAGSVTPSENGELIIAGISVYGNGPTAITVGLTIEEAVAYGSGTNLGCALAWIVQGVAAPINPEWSGNAATGDGSTGACAAVIATFKAA